MKPASDSDRLHDLQQFYDVIGRLADRMGGPRTLDECSSRMEWPRRGVYFFLESGEVRSDSGQGPRVVRVGTHAVSTGSQTTMWKRLVQHRGTIKKVGGNHRGSVFRLLIGASLIARDGIVLESWGKGGNAPGDVRASERDLERRVSEAIGRMPFVYVPLDDEPGRGSIRAFIERNAIALLSNAHKPHLDWASSTWLGHHCPKEPVQSSGLWNQNHVTDTYDPAFLLAFQEHAAAV